MASWVAGSSQDSGSRTVRLGTALRRPVPFQRYLLPELRVARFEQFHLRRAELRARYRLLTDKVIAECDGPTDADDLPFRLVESVINRRSDDTGCPPEQPWIIADGALRTLGFDGDFAVLRKQTAERLGLQPLGVV